MRSRISFITRTAKGGISYRHVDLDSDFVRFGRSTNNEIYLKDPRVPLDLAELHERPNGFFIEASGSIDIRHGGAITRAAHVKVGDTVALGPFDLVVIEPPEGFSVAATVELTRPLGDDLEELTARSTTSIVATGISRRRWAVGLFLLVIVLFAAAPLVGVFSPSIHQASLAWPVSVDIAWEPGQLSRPHDFFGDDCSQCHAQPFAQVRDQECLTCHEDISHHGDPVNYVGMGAARCANCHEEHNGWAAPVGQDARYCVACHGDLQSIMVAVDLANASDFSTEHPAFGERYPHTRRTAVNFDHVRHFDAHFVDQRYAERAPAGCDGCHTVAAATRSVMPRGFDATCAACHAGQIADREFVLLRLPEMMEPIIERDDLMEVCGPTLEAYEANQERLYSMAERLDLMRERVEAMAGGEDMEDGEEEEEDEEEEEFESVSVEELTPVAAYLLDTQGDDPDSYGAGVGALTTSMAEEGVGPLFDLIAEKTSEAEASRLIAGLNAEAVKRLACAWAANLEYEAPAEPMAGGWYGDYLELKYRPAGHADPVLRAWLDLAAATVTEDDEEGESLGAVRETLLSAQRGPGACIKCHAVTSVAGEAEAIDGIDSGALSIEWHYQVDEARPLHRYSHGAHLKLVRPGAVSMMDPTIGCANCHELDTKAPYAAAFDDFDSTTFWSNFKPINKEVCEQCHGPSDVAQNCQLCHSFHEKPTVRMAKSARQ